MISANHTLLLAAGLAAGLALSCGAAPLPGGLKAPSFSTAKLSAAEFEKLHAAVAPKGEAWEAIPWETDLGAARARAAKEKRPLLLWIMDGHPLGCT